MNALFLTSEEMVPLPFRIGLSFQEESFWIHMSFLSVKH